MTAVLLLLLLWCLHSHTHAMYRLAFKSKHNHGDKYTRTPSDVCVDWTVNFWSLLLHQTVSIVLTCSDSNLVVVIDFLCRFFLLYCVYVFSVCFSRSLFSDFTLWKKKKNTLETVSETNLKCNDTFFQTNLTSLNSKTEKIRTFFSHDRTNEHRYIEPECDDWKNEEKKRRTLKFKTKKDTFVSRNDWKIISIPPMWLIQIRWVVVFGAIYWKNSSKFASPFIEQTDQ